MTTSATASTRTHAPHKGHPLSVSRPNREDLTAAWATHANEGLHRENLDGSRLLGAARRFHAGGADLSANEAINASGALNRPRRSSGGTTASTASSFSEGSM